MLKKANRFLVYLLVLWTPQFTAYAQQSDDMYQSDVLNGLSKDSVILLIEDLIIQNQFQGIDSTSKVQIYKTLNRQQLHNYSLKLIEIELESCAEEKGIKKAELRTQKAFSLFRAGNYKDAIELFQSNADSAAKYSGELLVPIFGGLATIYFNQTEFDSAMKYAEQFLESARAVSDSLGTAEAFKLMGNISFSKTEFRESVKYHKQSISYSDSLILGSTYNELGRDYFYLEMFDSAFYYSEKSLKIKKLTGDTFGYCTSLGNTGHLYYYYGDKDKAMVYYNKCLSIAQEKGFKDLQTWMLKSISDYYYGIADYKLALEYFRSYSRMNDSLLYESDIRFAVEKAKSNSLNQKYSYNILKRENEIEKLRTLRLTYAAIGLSLLVVIAVMSIILIRLRNQKKNLELKQRIGRAQMNPHFIFNSLNALQQYILGGDIRASNKFLKKFSSLMRSTLESSYNDLHSLQKEILHLENYLSLEALRFEDEFLYELLVSSELDTKRYQVPSMIVQPFVENAIWHGLLPKKGADRKLTISFNAQNDHILCEIKDNGIGRDNAWKSNTSPGVNLEKESLGIDITNKRLEDLKNIYKSTFRIEIIDLTEDNSPAGTLVRLQLPIMF